MRVRRKYVPLVALLAACLTAGAQSPSAPPASHPIVETARAAHNLPPEDAARHVPIHLRAVVTYYDPYIDVRHGAIFVHDDSGGVFVSVPARPILDIKPGTLVDITGVSAPGDYAPVVNGSEVRAIGQSHLPANVPNTTLTELLPGAFECQWVQVEGRVRSAHVGPNNVVLGIAANGGPITAVTVRQPGVDYDSLVDSLVRIDGNAAPLFNQSRQMVGVHLFFPSLSQVAVIQAAPRDPFSVPALAISQLFRFSRDPGLLHRVHVRGAVTLDWPGQMVCIQDTKEGICMQTTQTAGVPVGTFVDVVGFPAINLFKPSLEDAVFRAIGGSVAAPPLASITPPRAA